MNKFGQHESTPISLFRGSLSFFEAARIIQSSGQKIPYSAFGALLAHSLELALKAFLLTIDPDEDKLINIRHDLNKAWDLSVKDGLNLEKTPPNWCETLSASHNAPYHFRYARVNTAIVLPPVVQTINDLNDVLIKVADKIGLDMNGNFFNKAKSSQ